MRQLQAESHTKEGIFLQVIPVRIIVSWFIVLKTIMFISASNTIYK